jgi:hypothetical protein
MDKAIRLCDTPCNSDDRPNGNNLPLRGGTMNAVALMIKHVNRGWAVTLPDGRELVRFTGFGAKRRALRFLATHDLGREASHAW